MIIHVELTDTFGGEANYSWCKRESFELADTATRATIMKHAKRCVGLLGARGRVEHFGNVIAFRPFGICQVMFITFN